MTSDSKINVSRRTVLAGLGTIGIASAGAGLGTSAYFSDEETFESNRIVAGALDLKVDWTEHYYDGAAGTEFLRRVDGATDVGDDEFYLEMEGDEPIRYAVTDLAAFMDATAIESFPDEDDDGIQDEKPEDVSECDFYGDMDEALSSARRTEATINGQTTAAGDPLVKLDDVKPGDWGEVTFSLHLCDNPGYVWLLGELLENAENGYTEPERKDPDEDGTDRGELADEMLVTLWYDTDGDNVLEDGERVIVTGSLSEVMALLSTELGIPLSAGSDFTPVQPVGDGTEELTDDDLTGDSPVAGNPTCGDRDLLRAIKIEGDELAVGDYATPVGTITITEVVRDGDGDPRYVDFTANFPVQEVIVKGGNAANVYAASDGATSGDDLHAPINASGNVAGVSHVSFCYAGDPGDGPGTLGERECFVNSTDAYVGFKWWLPVDHANEIQTDSVTFDLGFYTEQCRHNDGSGPQIATVDLPASQTGDGDSVFVNSAYLPDGGFVVVHDPNDGGAIIGVSDLLAPGAHVNLAVPLDSSPAGDEVLAMPHRDDDDSGDFGFPTNDAPYLDGDGDIVTDTGVLYAV
jgi:predicted ribosomally synthesized peptide with SipW-like signal peptide